MIEKKMSALTYILASLIPYTSANLKMVFHTSQFFDELDRRASGYSRISLRAAYAQARREQLVGVRDGHVELSLKARQKAAPFVAKQLSRQGALMVIFDIPEDYAQYRRQLRQVLRHLGFEQIQRSVWTSRLDHSEVLRDTIRDFKLDRWVRLYEAAQLDI